jgi:hypothetical protein
MHAVRHRDHNRRTYEHLLGNHHMGTDRTAAAAWAVLRAGQHQPPGRLHAGEEHDQRRGPVETLRSRQLAASRRVLALHRDLRHRAVGDERPARVGGAPSRWAWINRCQALVTDEYHDWLFVGDGVSIMVLVNRPESKSGARIDISYEMPTTPSDVGGCTQ